MSIFRNNNKWLKFRSLSELRKKNNDLYDSFWKTGFFKITEFICESKGWWIILLIVFFIFFSFAFLNKFFNIKKLAMFELSPETAKILVDQRAANIATIISITLVVVGFLINNIAIKESIAYRILFKHSYLYPITYSTLSVIFCFFIASTLRDQINSYYFINFVISGTYIAIFILLLIGILFKKIIQFADDKFIKELLHEELIIEVKEEIKENLSIKHSEQLFISELNKLGGIQSNPNDLIDLFFSGKELSENEILIIKNKERIINDINIKKISKFIKKKNSNNLNYKSLKIGSIISDADNYIWDNESKFNDKEKRVLRNCLILKKPRKIKREKETMRKYYDQKLEELIIKNDYRKVEDLLESFFELYNLQIKYSK